MPHKLIPRKLIDPETPGAKKVLVMPDESKKNFTVDSWEFTYGELRTLYSLPQEVVFVNRKGDRLRNETSALGPKTKVIKTRRDKY